VINIKQELLAHCHQWVDDLMTSAQTAIQELQDAANAETKSSAGDKYETGRAMAQLEIEKSTAQLHQAGKLKKALHQISIESKHTQIGLGSLVVTEHGRFFLSISAGNVSIEGQEYVCLSPVSPLGEAMTGLKAGEGIEFNSRQWKILSID